MNVEKQGYQEAVTLLRLSVVAEADPGSLARVVERIQGLNVIPHRVLAELDRDGVLRIQVDVAGLSENRLALIAAKIGQVPCVLNACWFRL